ncbi:MAG: DUF6361 family protein [Bacteroidia bacterium]|nr:DUF6361 family protein [Bacteroidia bacterium]
MAEIGWIDFSNKDRKKAQQLLAIIRPEGQLDELGVGYLRDALANQLFPGISTIQTRAKYFFIIPFILREYQKLSLKEKRRTTARQFLKEQEHSIKNYLREMYNRQEGLGIIGVTLSKNQYIKRNPSEIYWNGLQVYGFMNDKQLSLDQYLRNLSAQHALEKAKTPDEEDDLDSTYEEVLHINVPVNNNWFSELSIELTADEADFFHSQIVQVSTRHPASLLPVLLQSEELGEAFSVSENFQQFVAVSLEYDLNKEVKDLLILSHDFALLMEGIHLLYNHLLQLHIFPNDYDNSFETEWLDWRKNLQNNMIDYANFSPAEVYKFTKYKRMNTEVFLDTWWKLISESNKAALPAQQMKELIKRREYSAKGKKSRLGKPGSANTDVTLHKRLGLSLFQYRFYNAKTIFNDIKHPQ